MSDPKTIMLLIIAAFAHVMIILNVMYAINWGQRDFFDPYTKWWGWLIGAMIWLILTGLTAILLKC